MNSHSQPVASTILNYYQSNDAPPSYEQLQHQQSNRHDALSLPQQWLIQQPFLQQQPPILQQQQIAMQQHPMTAVTRQQISTIDVAAHSRTRNEEWNRVCHESDTKSIARKDIVCIIKFTRYSIVACVLFAGLLISTVHGIIEDLFWYKAIIAFSVIELISHLVGVYIAFHLLVATYPNTPTPIAISNAKRWQNYSIFLIIVSLPFDVFLFGLLSIVRAYCIVKVRRFTQCLESDTYGSVMTEPVVMSVAAL